MSVSTPLLDNTIEPDDSENVPSKPQSAKQPVVLSPTNRTAGSGAMATSQSDAESGTISRPSQLCPIPSKSSGIAGMLRQSAHPAALFFLYFFRTAAVVVYILCGWFTDNYVLSVCAYYLSIQVS